MERDILKQAQHSKEDARGAGLSQLGVWLVAKLRAHWKESVSIIGAAAHSSDNTNSRGQEIKASREGHNKIEEGKKKRKKKKQRVI